MSRTHLRDTAWFNELLSSETTSDYEWARSGNRFTKSDGDQRGTRLTSFVLLALIGIGFGTIAVLVNKTQPSVDQTRNQLISRVQEVSTRVENLEVSNQKLLTNLNKLTGQLLEGEGLEVRRDVKTQSTVAGLAGAKGPGVVLTLTEQGSTDEPTDLVMDSDVMVIVNGLWQSGATAIDVNGIAISGRTSIRNAGNAVLIDYTPVTSPFKIRAVGGTALFETFQRTEAWYWLEDLKQNYPIAIEVREWATVKVAKASVPTMEVAVRAEQ